MICNMEWARITGLMAKLITRSSKIFTRVIGFMGRGKVMVVSFTPMDASMKDISRRIARMARVWLWMKMAMLSWSIFRKINSFTQFLKVT